MKEVYTHATAKQVFLELDNNNALIAMHQA